jgi:vitamin K-dependent gamma-carboxylase
MEVFLSLGAFATLLVILGYKFRWAQLYVAICWTYIFLLDRGHYNNHYYLYSLLSFFMVFTSASKHFSIDRLLSKNTPERQVYRWENLFIQLQVFVIYFFGAIAKMNPDWLAGWPLRNWLAHDLDRFPTWYADFVTSEFGVYFYSYGGIVFDLVVGFALFHKRGRYFILPVLVFFHVSNHFFWNIGTFPWFSIIVTSIFFNPDWPTQVLRKLGFSVGHEHTTSGMAKGFRQNVTTTVFAVYMLIQFLMPLRQYMYKGDPGWHGYGHLFSWRMMLIDTVSGMQVKVKDEGDENFIYVAMEDYVTFRQFRKSSRTPAAFLDFAHFLSDEMKKGGAKNPVVHIKVFKSFNGRKYALLTDTTTNLAMVNETYFYVPDWILPGNEEQKPGELWE